VVSTAVENKDQVSVSFLINYLQQFFLINQSGISNRDLSKEQREALVKLLEEKLSTQ
jgi:G:T/U-mismatch repair DNA glycosylase